MEASQRVQDLKMDVIQAIRYIIKSWDEVNAETLGTTRNPSCWHQRWPTESLRKDPSNDRPVLDDLSEALQALGLPDPMQLEEFLIIPEENIDYEVPEGDQVIGQLVDIFNEKYE